MAIINNNRNNDKVTVGQVMDLKKLTHKIYTKEEMKQFSMELAINTHPLAKKPTILRSKLAYAQLLKELKPNKKYLIPGQLSCFFYQDPKFKEELNYFDQFPLTLFCGITRTDDGNIREIGFNLHYFPPHARAKVFLSVYNTFKHYFWDNFNEVNGKPNMMISYNALMRLCKRNAKIAFGIRMYIPVLRGTTYVIPTRLFSTAFYTEGRFSGATLMQIQSFWRRYR
ncbi:MAG: hypothetical protein J1F35_03610 [Erysipelotrichales bacterium]|nr:hypothetical protein [Erysipelotrichales bacterium]